MDFKDPMYYPNPRVKVWMIEESPDDWMGIMRWDLPETLVNDTGFEMEPTAGISRRTAGGKYGTRYEYGRNRGMGNSEAFEAKNIISDSLSKSRKFCLECSHIEKRSLLKGACPKCNPDEYANNLRILDKYGRLK